MRILRQMVRIVGVTLTLVFCGLTLTTDVYRPTAISERLQGYVSGQTFDFGAWTWNAIGIKLAQASVDEQLLMSEADRSALVREFFELRTQLNQVEGEINQLYADPEVSDPATASSALREQQTQLRVLMAERQPLAEAILQEQVAVIFAEQSLAMGGQPFPPPAFHFTPLPLAMIVSPRTEIKQIAVQMLNGDLTLDQQVTLENRAAQGLDVSVFVTPVGGIGTYPAMVAQSSDLNWIANVTAHEWAHNYLTLRPLGLLYDASPELRTLNESVAELVGNEIGALIIRRYYPDIAPAPPGFNNFLDRTLTPPEQSARPDFDFRAEMRITRLRADELLAQGQVAQAEAHMEERRQFFWENGYRLRKLNQAYFAFYGAYNATPGGGASGADPIGPAVRLLRRRSTSAVEFLRTMAWFTSVREFRDYLSLP